MIAGEKILDTLERYGFLQNPLPAAQMTEAGIDRDAVQPTDKGVIVFQRIQGREHLYENILKDILDYTNRLVDGFDKKIVFPLVAEMVTVSIFIVAYIQL